MKYSDKTGRSIPEAFEDYHYDHPDIYIHFKKFAFDLIATGMKKISAKLIIERVRWEIYMGVTDTDCFKINNVFTSYYARLFVDDYPEHQDKFEFRRLKSKSGIQRKIQMK